MKKTFHTVSLSNRLLLLVCLMLLPLQAAIAQTEAEVRKTADRLIAGLEQKAADLRRLEAKNPGSGAGRLADDLETRLRAIKQAGVKPGTTLYDKNAAAYVNMGNTIRITHNFFDDKLYDDKARQAILLHEAKHLEQPLWERELLFFSPDLERDAYKEEYKWLVVLDGSGFEKYNVMEALRVDYGVIRSDDDTAGLHEELGLTPELLVLINGDGGQDRAVQSSQPHENQFYAFRLPADWNVEFGTPGDTKQRYVHMNKEVKRHLLSDGSVGASMGVYLTLGEVIGAAHFGPSVEKLCNDELEKDRKWDFSGGKDKRTFSNVNRILSGRSAAGYRKVVTEENGDDPPTVTIAEKYYFKKDQVYYYTDFSYRKDFLKAVSSGYDTFLDSLVVK